MSKAVKKEEEKQEYDFDNPITIPLKYPVKFGGEEITEVVLQPLTGRHIRGLSTSPSMDDLIRIASKASGLSEKIFEKMRTKDLMEITQIVGEAL